MFLGEANQPSRPSTQNRLPDSVLWEAALQRWSCSLVSFGGKIGSPSHCAASCWLSSHRSFGVRIWRRIRCRSSTYAPARTPDIALEGSPIRRYRPFQLCRCDPLRLCQNGGTRNRREKSYAFLVDEAGDCRRIVHFASTFCKKLRRIGALLEILSRCGQRFAKTIDEAPSNSRQWQDAARELRVSVRNVFAGLS